MGFFVFYLDLRGWKINILKFEMLAEEVKKSFNSVWMAFWWKQSSRTCISWLVDHNQCHGFMSRDELVCHVGRSPREGFHRQWASRAQFELVAT